MIRTIAIALSLTLAAAAGLAKPEPLPVDPVVLVEHDEHLAGEPGITAEHEGRVYRFVNEASREVFRANPARYAVRLGGSCARMGPFSGEGRVDLYAAVDGRVYLFASESCRETFLEHHDRLLESDDPAIEPSPESAAAAAEVLARAVRYATGGKGINTFAGFEIVRLRQVESGGNDYEHEVRTRYGLRRLLLEHSERWNERVWRRAWAGDRGTLSDPNGLARAMASDQIDACRREALRHPLAMLAAFERGDAVAESVGQAGAGDGVRLHAGGVTMDLVVDDAGAIVSSACRDRASSMMIGTVERRYLGSTTTGGLRVPTDYEVTVDGERVPGMDRRGLEAEASPPEAG
jgi:YHS domain-containing protein